MNPDASLLTLFPEMQREVSPHTTGLLPSQRIEEFIDAKQIAARIPIEPSQVQPASLDLRLGEVAYRVRASFLPGKRPVTERLELLKTHELDLSSGAVL